MYCFKTTQPDQTCVPVSLMFFYLELLSKKGVDLNNIGLFVKLQYFVERAAF